MFSSLLDYSLLVVSMLFASDIRSTAAEAVAAWLDDEAIPLASVAPGDGFEDLRPLEQRLKGVQLIGLGEATHGTHEFFTLKHRLLEFLVTELGFTTLLLEAGYPATSAVNDYVLYGKGDPEAALTSLGFWIWDTREMAALISWLRIHNQRVPADKKVSFLGFDFQHSEAAVREVRAFLERTLPAEAERFSTVLSGMFAGAELTRDATISARLLPQLQRLVSTLEQRKGELTRKTSEAAYEHILLQARVLAQHADAYSEPEAFVTKRNRYMAENILTLLAGKPSGTRAAVWAHNDHIATTPAETGIYLKDALGDAYYALALSFDSGTFGAREQTREGLGNVKVWNVAPAPSYMLNWYFAAAQPDDFIIDFRRPPADPVVQKWLATLRPFRLIGCVVRERDGQNWTERGTSQIRLSETFDGVAFVSQTTRAKPNLPIHLGETPC